jgi:hypothetical protein
MNGDGQLEIQATEVAKNAIMSKIMGKGASVGDPDPDMGVHPNPRPRFADAAFASSGTRYADIMYSSAWIS